MKALICRMLGHRWVGGVPPARSFYSCTRCGEPGFWVPS